MSDDLRTIETMQENAEHFGDVVARVANALTRNAPHVYAPESDDMTVEFAIQLAEKDEKIEQQARRITQWEMAYGELLEEREIKNGQIAALRSAQEWQDISTAPKPKVLGYMNVYRRKNGDVEAGGTALYSSIAEAIALNASDFDDVDESKWIGVATVAVAEDGPLIADDRETK